MKLKEASWVMDGETFNKFDDILHHFYIIESVFDGLFSSICQATADHNESKDLLSISNLSEMVLESLKIHCDEFVDTLNSVAEYTRDLGGAKEIYNKISSHS